MIKLLLRMFDLVAPLVRAIGVDYAQFRAILEIKLTLDTRRSMIVSGQAQRQPGRKPGNALAGSMLFSGLMGVMIGFMPYAAHSPLVSMTFVHTFIMVMLGMTLVADFSSVLLDTTDNAVLAPRPVSGRTILVARIAHICVYLALLSLSLSFATLGVGTHYWGWGFLPIYLFTLVCSIGMVVCVVNLFYMAAIQFTSGEKLRDIITMVQVVLSVGMFAGYQFLPRLIDMRAVRDLRIDDRGWIYLFPPTWMAAPIDLAFGQTGSPQWVLSGMAVLIPLLGMVLVTRVLGPRFSRALATLDEAPVARRPLAPGASKPCRRPGSIWARLCCRNATGRAAFEFVWVLCGRDRQFKQRTYPSLAFVLLFPMIWVTTGNPDIRVALRELPGTQKHLLALYAACAMLPSALMQIRFSNNAAAAWIYSALPIARPGEVFAGATKALMVRFALPAFAVVSAGVLAVWGSRVLADVLLAATVTFFVCVIQALLMGRHFPFSEIMSVVDASGRAYRVLFLMLLPAGLGGVHYLLTFMPGLVLLAIPLVLAGALLLLRVYARTSWEAVAD